MFQSSFFCFLILKSVHFTWFRWEQCDEGKGKPALKTVRESSGHWRLCWAIKICQKWCAWMPYFTWYQHMSPLKGDSAHRRKIECIWSLLDDVKILRLGVGFVFLAALDIRKPGWWSRTGWGGGELRHSYSTLPLHPSPRRSPPLYDEQHELYPPCWAPQESCEQTGQRASLLRNQHHVQIARHFLFGNYVLLCSRYIYNFFSGPSPLTLARTHKYMYMTTPTLLFLSVFGVIGLGICWFYYKVIKLPV